MSGNSYNRLLHEVDVVVVIDAAFYNDQVLLSSKPNAKQPYVRYHIFVVILYYKAQSSVNTMHEVLI
jgi:hypothetical protein